MGIDHDMVLGSLGHGIEVVVDHPLSVVVLTAGDDVAHVAALHGVVAILLHELVGLVIEISSIFLDDFLTIT